MTRCVGWDVFFFFFFSPKDQRNTSIQVISGSWTMGRYRLDGDNLRFGLNRLHKSGSHNPAIHNILKSSEKSDQMSWTAILLLASYFCFRCHPRKKKKKQNRWLQGLGLQPTRSQGERAPRLRGAVQQNEVTQFYTYKQNV